MMDVKALWEEMEASRWVHRDGRRAVPPRFDD